MADKTPPSLVFGATGRQSGSIAILRCGGIVSTRTGLRSVFGKSTIARRYGGGSETRLVRRRSFPQSSHDGRAAVSGGLRHRYRPLAVVLFLSALHGRTIIHRPLVERRKRLTQGFGHWCD